MKTIDEAERRSWSNARDPGMLFMAWWALSAEWEPADRAVLLSPSAAIRNRFSTAISLDDERQAVVALLHAIEAEWPATDDTRFRLKAAGLILQAMRSVDEAFALLHPRTRALPPIFGAPPRKPAWLAKAELRRLSQGDFGESDDCRLILNGPFSRYARGRDASSANSLQDQFPFLTVAPTKGRQETRTIRVDMKVIGTDAMRGVPAAASIGCERIRFIPLAEASSDLIFRPGTRGSQPTLDVRPTVNTAARLLEGLQDGRDIDIAFAPELTVRGQDESLIGAGVAGLAIHAPRIILAGSGVTATLDDDGRPWNEARVFARGGKVLWRQRKIWPFGMQQAQALTYKFPDPGAGETLMEDIAGHSELTVVDMDGFGRCVVLICQDVESRPVVDEIVARYQPDWILIPVLDPGVRISGWAHQRAFNLSKQAQARYLVGSSLTLSQLRGDAVEPPVGLAVGPAEPTPAHPGTPVLRRSVAVVQAASGRSPRVGLLVWDHKPPVWLKSAVGAELDP